MKSLSFAERHNLPRYVVQQVYYSLIGRNFELDLMPLEPDQGIGAAVWSPLGWGGSPESCDAADRCRGNADCKNPTPTRRVSKPSVS
jgi:aryl-alcohol dehydrogenase-like predicted oxidoreductase